MTTLVDATRKEDGVQLLVVHENATFNIRLKQYEATLLRNRLNVALAQSRPPQNIVAIVHGPTGGVEKEVALDYPAPNEYRVDAAPINYDNVATPHGISPRQVRYRRGRIDHNRGLIGGPIYYHYHYAGEF